MVGGDAQRTGSGPGVGARPADRGARAGLAGLRARPAALVAVAALAVPIAVAGVRAARRGWLPVGDDGLSATRAQDVLTSQQPLLGTWSSASQWIGDQVNHPGPLQFEVLALPVRLFGPGAGTALGTAATNVACVLVADLLALRVAGRAGALALAASTAVLLWSFGSELLFDPWSQYAPLLPFLLVLVGTWAAGAGHHRGLVAAVVAGSFALQTHLSYVLLVPGLVGLATVGHLLALRRSPAPERRGRLLALAVATALALALWSPVLVDEVAGEGNLSALLNARDAEPPATPGLGDGLQATGAVVALPPFWLPSGWGDPTFDVAGEGQPRGLVLGALAAVVGACAVLGERARRRGDRTVAAGLATAVAGIALCALSASRSTSPFGLFPTYVRWLWPMSSFTWTVLVTATWREVRLRRGALAPGVRTRAEWAAAAAVVLLAAAAVPTRDGGTAAPPDAIPVARSIQDQALPALEDKGPVRLALGPSVAAGVFGPPLMAALLDHGIEFTVDDDDLVRQMGEDRRADGSAESVATLAFGDTAFEVPSGSRRIAFEVALSPAEARQRQALRSEIEASIRARGTLPLTELGRTRLADGDNVALGAEGEEAVALLASGQIEVLGDFELLDLEALSPEFATWADLEKRYRDRTIAIFLRPA